MSLLAVTPVMADTLYLTNLPVFTYDGYYVGPATGNLNGGASFSLVCDDFAHTTYVPSHFDTYVSTIPELQHAMYITQGVDTYERAAILMWQMGLVNQTSADIGGIQFAIWNLFNPAATPNPGSSDYWVSWANSQVLSAWDYSGVRIYTPSNSLNQEFIGGAASPVPEPMTFVLIGTGLIGLSLLKRRRKTTTTNSE
jgi:hypothetical protein